MLGPLLGGGGRLLLGGNGKDRLRKCFGGWGCEHEGTSDGERGEGGNTTQKGNN